MRLDPEGCIEVVYQLEGSFFQRTFDQPNWSKRPFSFIGGLHSKSFEVKSKSGDARLLSIRFHPLGTRSFIRQNLSEFKNSITDLDDFLPIESNRLLGASEEKIIGQVEKDLQKSFKTFNKNILDIALEKILGAKGFVNIEQLTYHLSVSSSYLRRLFAEQIGMSPKQYCRILRFRNCVFRLNDQSYSSLTDLAYQMGYFDQSHFIKDFKAITGKSPKVYMSRSL